MVKRQKHRSNYHTDNPEKYFKINVFLPFLVNLVQQLNDRFINHKTIIAGFYFLISNKNYNQQAIKDLSEFYSDDIDQEVIETEVKLWHTHLEKLSIKSVLDALDNCNKNLFPNVFKVLQIFATLPVTSCEPGRSFSTLKQIKTYLRNSIGQFRLNGLAFLNIHREVEVIVEEVIQKLSFNQKWILFYKIFFFSLLSIDNTIQTLCIHN
ncbi:Ribonuclease H-like domain,HAT, C-terminal dimerisation domain [Cinara cedri]|uniref:Ribonuclease H-like domain,HAT, C-terminal dimerisation domain n=1 Tax=Cinara cedri TaxID=506608 RepID=A0A5E4MSS5_9HEMI|nr:Ribonuclease H-like domain,HAT, C-terminal dimerisation domain [Cinara cedri]